MAKLLTTLATSGALPEDILNKAQVIQTEAQAITSEAKKDLDVMVSFELFLILN